MLDAKNIVHTKSYVKQNKVLSLFIQKKMNNYFVQF